MESVIVRVGSHRARHKLYALLGVSELQWYYNFEDGNNFAAIPTDCLAEARTITGVTLARPKGKLFKCWSL